MQKWCQRHFIPLSVRILQVPSEKLLNCAHARESRLVAAHEQAHSFPTFPIIWCWQGGLQRPGAPCRCPRGRTGSWARAYSGAPSPATRSLRRRPAPGLPRSPAAAQTALLAAATCVSLQPAPAMAAHQSSRLHKQGSHMYKMIEPRDSQAAMPCPTGVRETHLLLLSRRRHLPWRGPN